jgi:hypothetical protein
MKKHTTTKRKAQGASARIHPKKKIRGCLMDTVANASSKMANLLERMEKLKAQIEEEKGKSAAETALNTLGASLAGYLTTEAGKAKIDLKVLSGKFLALKVDEAGKLSIEVATKPAPVKTTSTTTTTTTTTDKTGKMYEYVGADGQVLGDTVQAAMDKLGIDKASRPGHNRYDRLSADWKKKIIQREKVAAPAETPASPAATN